jgi:hypothetical protein
MKYPDSSIYLQLFNGNGLRPYELVAKNGNSELVFLRGNELYDNHYLFIDSAFPNSKAPLVAEISYPGMIQSIYFVYPVEDTSLSRKIVKTPILERPNAYGMFEYHGSPGVEGLESLLDYTYSRIKQMEYTQEHLRVVFENWSGKKLIERFTEFNHQYTPSDIIPEYNDNMIIAKTSDECVRTCIMCPLGTGSMNLYSLKRIINNMEEAKRVLHKYHGTHLDRMDEGFLNSSDILLYHIARKFLDNNLSNSRLENLVKKLSLIDEYDNLKPVSSLRAGQLPDVIDIIKLFRENFPYVRKIGAFMGVLSTLETERQYLNAIYESGLTRVLPGVETGDEITSKLLGKSETFDEKVSGITKLLSTGFKTKVIVQVGFVGEGFYYKDNSGQRVFRSSKEGLAETAKLFLKLANIPLISKNCQLQISSYVPVENTPMARLHRNLSGILPYDSPDGLVEDIQYLLDLLQKDGIDIYSKKVQGNYEIAIHPNAIRH